MDKKFNMRNPVKGEVSEMMAETKRRRAMILKYKLLKQLLAGETIDLTQSPALFEALNRERMEFEEILKLHPEQANEAILAAKEDRESVEENVYWNRESPAKWARLGHIPPCVYYARPAEYWSDSKLLKNFFNTFTKFRISTNRI
jgi:hypothetical protein